MSFVLSDLVTAALYVVDLFFAMGLVRRQVEDAHCADVLRTWCEVEISFYTMDIEDCDWICEVFVSVKHERKWWHAAVRVWLCKHLYDL